MPVSTWTRRQFLSSTLAGSSAWASGRWMSAADPSENRTVDTNGAIDAHSHIWTREVTAFPLARGKTVDDLDPPSFTAEELLATARPAGVTRVVLIAHHLFYSFDNSYLIHAAEQNPGTFKVVALLDDTQPNLAAKMQQLRRRHVTGFRITPFIRGAEIWLDNPGMQEMWRTAAETGQAMCCLIDASHLEQVDRMCEQHPETPVVIDHFARIGIDGEIRAADLNQLTRLARHRNTRVKISAYYALGRKQPPHDELLPMIRRVYEAFGPERLMWASDAPYQMTGGNTYASSLALIRERADFLSDEDKAWLLRKAAEQVYFA